MVLSDEELLYLILSGSELAFIELYNVYYHIAWKLVRDMVDQDNYRIDMDELILDVVVNFMELIYQYRSDRNASFRTYIKICIRNRIYTSMKKQRRLNLQERNVISLDTLLRDKHPVGNYYFATPKEEQPDIKLLIKEDIESYKQYTSKMLTKKEQMVYNYMNLGYSPSDIAKIMNISMKSYYNTAYRVSKKMAKLK